VGKWSEMSSCLHLLSSLRQLIDFLMCSIWEEEEESGGNGSDCVVRIHSNDVISDFLSVNGSVPIPPYLHREAVESDKERYNNVYAKDGGSVAAPTAGLHFTDESLDELGESNISSLTLHVGAGTFMPVRSEGKNRDMVYTVLHLICVSVF
jgi:S-adenosylmethionine:tRNA ribosyltransferase-isomerase